MSDFTSDFWHWFIVIITLGSISWTAFLLYSNSKVKLEKGQDVKSTGHVWDGIEELNTPLPKWWSNLFYITIIFALIYLVLYPGLGTYKGALNWTQVGQYNDEIKYAEENYNPLFEKYRNTGLKELATNDEAMKTGERLFSAYCSVCHGSDARGAKGFPNLRDDEWLWGGSPEQIKDSILNGRHGTMPAWSTTLGDKGVEEVSAHVMNLSGRSVDQTKAAAGKAHFAMCVGCHGVDGKGNVALGAPDLTNKSWTYGGSPKSIQRSIANGRTGIMPAHKDFLGESRVHVLAAYVLSLSEKK